MGSPLGNGNGDEGLSVDEDSSSFFLFIWFVVLFCFVFLFCFFVLFFACGSSTSLIDHRCGLSLLTMLPCHALLLD